MGRRWPVRGVRGDDERGVRAYLVALASTSRGGVAAAVLLTVITGLAEAASIAVLVVVLRVIGLEPGSGGMGGLAAAVRRLFNAANVTSSLGPVLAVYVVAGLLLAVVRRLQSVNTARLCLAFATRLRADLFGAIADSSWLALSRARASDLTHVLTSEVDRVTAGTQQLVALTSTVVVSSVYLAFAVRVSPGATGVALLFGATLLVLLRWRARAAGRAGLEVSRATASLYAAVIEHVAGLKAAKSHGAERASVQLVGQRAQHVADSQIAAAKTIADLKLGHEAGVVLAAATVLGVTVGLGNVTPAGALLLLFLFLRVAPALSTVQQGWSRVAQMLPAFTSMTELQASFRAAAEPEPATDEVPVMGRGIDLENVSFAYLPGRRRAALVNVDLTIRAGCTTAVVGESGSGKTTLVDMVCGLLAPTGGRVLLDGRPLEPGMARAWRSQVGYVGQDPLLLHDTVRANLACGRPAAEEAAVWDSLRQASAAGFVAELPEGLDTVVGDRGVRLSGGERQRLALARALLRRPSLLVLDEATSNLDSDNEARIQEAIDGLRGVVTILVVAHRLATVRNADVVCVLEVGRLVALGSWDQLASDAHGRFGGLLSAQRLDGISDRRSSSLDPR